MAELKYGKLGIIQVDDLTTMLTYTFKPKVGGIKRVETTLFNVENCPKATAQSLRDFAKAIRQNAK
jgi:hypothetical protein